MTNYKRLKSKLKDLEKTMSKKELYPLLFFSSSDGASINITASGRNNKWLDVTVSTEKKFLEFLDSIESAMGIQTDYYNEEAIQADLGEKIVVGSLWHDMLKGKYYTEPNDKDNTVVFLDDISD